MEREGTRVTAATFLGNLEAKLTNPSFLGDLDQLITADLEYDTQATANTVRDALISRL
ncbi:MAG: hypothetical protein HQ523_13005 [Lentisphaerae bacterium]|nr:hypothetical protein [Lentisphaerota bacterium]